MPINIFLSSVYIQYMGNTLCECIATSNISLTQQKLSLNLNNPPSISLRNIALSSLTSSDSQQSTLSTNDFEPTKLLDTGCLGNVIAVRKRNSSDEKLYAMKVIDKLKLKNGNMLQCQTLEKAIAKKYCQFLVFISHIIQNPKKMFVIMEYIEPGDLLFYLSKQKCFKEEIIRQVGSEVLQGLKFLNKEGIIHANLKPENILVMADGHVKLSGYWHSTFRKEHSLSNGFIQSLEYTAPEMLTNETDCDRVDLWGFGILLYQMLHGKTPFNNNDDEGEIKQAILTGEYKITDECSQQLKILIKQLLSLNPNSRPTISEVENNKFFKQIEWSSLIQRRNQSPLKQLVQKFNTRSNKAKYEKPKRVPYIPDDKQTKIQIR